MPCVVAWTSQNEIQAKVKTMSTAPRYQPHYTYEDYCQWSGDWELWDGVAIAMTPSPFGPHEQLVSRLSFLFASQIDRQECDCVVYTGLDWVVSGDTVVRPDVMIVCGEQPEHHLQHAPSLAVEVTSPSTESKDRHEKHTLYEEQGVLFYLIANPSTQSLIGFRYDGQSFRKIESLASETIALHDGCTMRIDLDQLKAR